MPADVFTNDGLKVRTEQDYLELKDRLVNALKGRATVLIMDEGSDKECTLVLDKISAIVNVPVGMTAGVSKPKMN